MSIMYILHPSSNRLSRLALESITEGVVTSVTTLHSQLLGGEGSLGSDSLVIEADEMIDAQILAEVVAVGANLHGKPRKRDIILQVEARLLAILFQQ